MNDDLIHSSSEDSPELPSRLSHILARTTPDPVPTVTPASEFATPRRIFTDTPITELPKAKRRGKHSYAGDMPNPFRTPAPKRTEADPEPELEPEAEVEPEPEPEPEPTPKKRGRKKGYKNVDRELSPEQKMGLQIGRARRRASLAFTVALPDAVELLVQIGLGKLKVDKIQYDALKEIVAQADGKPAQKPAPAKEENTQPVLNFDMPFLAELEARSVDMEAPEIV